MNTPRILSRLTLLCSIACGAFCVSAGAWAEIHVGVVPSTTGAASSQGGPERDMIGGVLEHMQKKNIKTVGYIGYSQPWGDQVYRSLTTLSGKYGVKVLNDERFARNDSSVMPQVLKTLALKPDAVLVGATGTPAALPHLTLVERGFKGPVYHTHGVVNDDFLRAGGPRIDGALAPIGPVVVYKDLPDGDPVKAVSLNFAALMVRAEGGSWRAER